MGDLPPLPEPLWARVEAFAEAVCDYSTAVRIDVGDRKAGERCLAIEKDLRAAIRAYAEEAVKQEREAKDAEIAAWKADALRYRWLRQQDWFDGPLCVLRDPKRVLTRGVGLGADCPSRDRLDAAIDAEL